MTDRLDIIIEMVIEHCNALSSTYRGLRGNNLEVCSFCVHGDTMASVGLMKYCL